MQQSNGGYNSAVAEMSQLKGTYAVASGKGGVGKTWFAITLSYALANLGRKTLLFDGDLGLPMLISNWA